MIRSQGGGGNRDFPEAKYFGTSRTPGGGDKKGNQYGETSEGELAGKLGRASDITTEPFFCFERLNPMWLMESLKGGC